MGEVLPPGRTNDEEKDMIESESGGEDDFDNITTIKRQLQVKRDIDGNIDGIDEA